ncbi:MAG: glycosyltransferase [Chloroflexota bacterium]|nr:glycosyltransferase [Chloroflexota bacterium]
MPLTPRYSVIIPTYNRPARLRECLTAIAALDFPRDRREVIIVDDGSPTALDAVVAPFRSALDLRLIRQDNAGPASARNAGIAAASGSYAVFTDDDCAPEASWLRAIEEHFAVYPDVMIGGRTVNRLLDNPYSASSQRIVDVVYRHYNADLHDARFIASNNMALPLDALRAVGGFDPAFHFAEDRELCDRWRFSGRKIHYLPGARIQHAHALTLASYTRQHLAYGRGAHDFHTVRAARGSGTLAAETGFHADVNNWLIRPVMETPGVGGKLMTLALLALWQGANAVGYLSARLGLRR